MTSTFLAEVQEIIRDQLESSFAGRCGLNGNLITGKMLRSRMAAHLGAATGVPRSRLALGAAAVEMFHTASLLHDDIIDGSTIRRGAPADWIVRGPIASILLGDRLLVHALELLYRTGVPSLQTEFVKILGDICDAEIEEQQANPTNLPSIARRKTGGLFAFVGVVSSCEDSPLRAALRECGYEFGWAYQIADDLRDRAEDVIEVTLADCPDSIQQHLATCAELLQPWPRLEAHGNNLFWK